jgi:hypothetical protein
MKGGDAMKTVNWIKFCALALVLAISFSGDEAWARRHRYSHSRVRVGVGIGLGLPFYSPFYSYRPYAYPYYPSYYSYPYYYGGYYGAYAPVVINRAPPVYIERAAIEAGSSETAVAQSPRDRVAQETYWYYCAASKGYYPYIDKCPSGWRKVLSRPDGAQ